MKGVLVGVLLAALVLSCAVRGSRGDIDFQIRLDKTNEVMQLWTQIRGFRADMGMPLDPSPSTENQIRLLPAKDSGKVCTENHFVPKVCEDTCTLSDHICENAELICKIADELGKEDRAQEKCTSSKASCREAKQRCCNCSSKPPVVDPPDAPGAPAAPVVPIPPTTQIKGATIVPKKVAR